jgi:predicted GH43/DUF377 family glycosyl hydrolase
MALMLLSSVAGFCADDLEEMQQKFVLSTKRITIPTYPDAFNPSIVRWKGHLLMSFRARDPLTFATNLVGFVWLKEDFTIVGAPKLLQVYRDYGGKAIQDPRLITIGEDLYMVYSNIVPLPDGGENRRVFVARVDYDGDIFSIDQPDALLCFDGDARKKWEKNWVPFEYDKSLLLSYSIQPHKVFYPLLGSDACRTIAFTQSNIQWDWGDIYGGTPAYIVGNEYLAFFHSSCVKSTVHSNEKPIPHYFMGAYTFQREPPFAITQVSPEPIIGPKFYSGPAYKTWKPLRVVYPCGYVFNENNIWVAYGRQDHEVWVIKLDKKGLLKSLNHVSSQDESE